MENQESDSMKVLLEYLAQNLVENSEAVVVKERVSRFNVIYELSVAPTETGKVIGRNGRIAKALRDVMGVVAARQNKRIHLDIK
jgi:predicted RNA-binding protein YlqC (UPF0109 family)